MLLWTRFTRTVFDSRTVPMKTACAPLCCTCNIQKANTNKFLLARISQDLHIKLKRCIWVNANSIWENLPLGLVKKWNKEDEKETENFSCTNAKNSAHTCKTNTISINNINWWLERKFSVTKNKDVTWNNPQAVSEYCSQTLPSTFAQYTVALWCCRRTFVIHHLSGAAVSTDKPRYSSPQPLPPTFLDGVLRQA